MNGYNVMDAKEVIKKFREEVHPFVLTRVVDTGEYYVAFVCTRGGRCTYSNIGARDSRKGQKWNCSL